MLKKPPGRLGEIREFIVYYGQGTSAAEQAIATYDLAILELRNWTPEAIGSLREKGTRIFGYFSVMETPAWNAKRASRVQESDYLYNEGSRIHFAHWDSYLIDLRSVHYRILLLEEIAELQAAYSPDGLFLDTVGDIEEFAPESLRVELALSYRKLLAVAAGRFPGLQWIQNRGFAQLPACAHLLDGLLWEDWNGERISTAWSNERLAQLEKHRREGLTLLSLSHDRSPIHANTAAKRKFIHSTAKSKNYDTF